LLAPRVVNIKQWIRLANAQLFERVRADFGTVVWPGELDVAPESFSIVATPRLFILCCLARLIFPTDIFRERRYNC